MDRPVDVHAEDSRLAALAAPFTEDAKVPIRGRVFSGETIYLDGRRFVECTFRNCTIRIAIGWFALDRCSFDGTTRLEAVGLAQGALKLATLLNITPGGADA